MQIQRRRVTNYVIIFGWLTLFGISSIFQTLYPEITVLAIVFPIVLLLSLIGMILINHLVIKDDMIKITKRDILLSKIFSYITVFLMIILIIFGYIIKNDSLMYVLKLVAASLLIAIGIFGAIYFSVITFKKPKDDYIHTGTVIDADFEETDNNTNLPS